MVVEGKIAGGLRDCVEGGGCEVVAGVGCGAAHGIACAGGSSEVGYLEAVHAELGGESGEVGYGVVVYVYVGAGLERDGGCGVDVDLDLRLGHLQRARLITNVGGHLPNA